MKYADSFETTITQTAAGTSYSEWFDVDFANELYAWTVVAFAESVTGDESTTLTLERKTMTSQTTVLTFATVTTDATEEEKHAYYPETDGSAPDVHNQLGTRVRFKVVSTGSAWTSSQSIQHTCQIHAKRN